MSDLSLIIEYSPLDAYKNNSTFTGSFTITGTTAPGANSRVFTATLPTIPDMTDIVFNQTGSANWFKQGSITVLGNGGVYVNYPTDWYISSNIAGTTLTITCIYSQQFNQALTLTPQAFSFKVVNYSGIVS